MVRAGERAVPDLAALVAPFAPGVLADYRRAGHQLVLSTTTPEDMIRPFAETLGFDDVWPPATRWSTGRYTGRLEGGFVWGLGKLQAVRRWAGDRGHRPGRLPRLLGQLLRRARSSRASATRTPSTPTPA